MKLAPIDNIFNKPRQVATEVGLGNLGSSGKWRKNTKTSRDIGNLAIRGIEDDIALKQAATSRLTRRGKVLYQIGPSAFETRRTMQTCVSQIASESEVWIAEDIDHMIHFNGERFFGPYSDVVPT